MFDNVTAFCLYHHTEVMLYWMAIVAFLAILSQIANKIAIRQRGEHGGGLLALLGFTVLVSGWILLAFIYFFYAHTTYAPSVWFKPMPPYEKTYFENKTANDKQLNGVRLPISIAQFVHLENEYKQFVAQIRKS